MHCSDIEWKNDMEIKSGYIIDQYVYLPLIKTLRKTHDVSIYRKLEQKSQYQRCYVKLTIDHHDYFIEEQFVWCDEQALYFDVSYRQIKPWPPKRQYGYLFDDWDSAHSNHLYLFYTYLNGSYTFYLMTYDGMKSLFSSCHLTQEQLFSIDKKAYKRKKDKQVYDHYALYWLSKWRSQRTVLALNEDGVSKYCVLKQKENIDELYNDIIRY